MTLDQELKAQLLELTKAYQKGIHAQQAGVSLSDNPFNLHDERRSAWFNGYIACEHITARRKHSAKKEQSK